MSTDPIQNEVMFGPNKFRITWISSQDLSQLQPSFQAYGICFNDQGEILIISGNTDPWSLPGGHREGDETPEEALKRELIEEADIEIKDIHLLGGQLVTQLTGDTVDRNGFRELYQLRYFCRVKNILPQTPDPDNGKIRERRFVPAAEITQVIRWGTTGAAMFQAAIDFYHRTYA